MNNLSKAIIEFDSEWVCSIFQTVRSWMASDGGTQAQYVNTQLNPEFLEASCAIVANTLKEKFQVVAEYLQSEYG